MDSNITVGVGKNVTILLNNLASQIGTTTKQIFPWYVKQQVLDGYIYLTVCTVTLILGISMVLICYKKSDSRMLDSRILNSIIILSCIFSMIAFIFLISGASTSITGIINPNYSALKSLTHDMSRLLH